jgi:V/A-type H+-transporting ATPase subunit B
VCSSDLIGWDLLSVIPERDLKRISPKWIEKYYPKHKKKEEQK